MTLLYGLFMLKAVHIRTTHSFGSLFGSICTFSCVSLAVCVCSCDLVDPSFQVEVEVYCAIPNDAEHTTKPSTPVKSVFRKMRKVSRDCYAYRQTFLLRTFQLTFSTLYVLPTTSVSLLCLLQDHSDSPTSYGGAAHSSTPHSGYTPPFQSTHPTHRFAIAGHTVLSLKDLASPTNTFPLKKGAVGSSGTAATGGGDSGPLLPLWGQFCCRLVAQPECAVAPRATGFINVQVRVKG